MSLAGVKTLASGSARPLEQVTKATTDELGATLGATFRAADNLQRGVVGWFFSLAP